MELVDGERCRSPASATGGCPPAGGARRCRRGRGAVPRPPAAGSSTATSSRPTSWSSATDGAGALIDFGIAHSLEVASHDLTRTGIVAGHAALHGPGAAGGRGDRSRAPICGAWAPSCSGAGRPRALRRRHAARHRRPSSRPVRRRSTPIRHWPPWWRAASPCRSTIGPCTPARSPRRCATGLPATRRPRSPWPPDADASIARRPQAIPVVRPAPVRRRGARAAGLPAGRRGGRAAASRGTGRHRPGGVRRSAGASARRHRPRRRHASRRFRRHPGDRRCWPPTGRGAASRWIGQSCRASAAGEAEAMVAEAVADCQDGGGDGNGKGKGPRRRRRGKGREGTRTDRRRRPPGGGASRRSAAGRG